MYMSIVLRKMEAIVFIILQIFFATRAVLKIGEYPLIFPGFRWGIFSCDLFRPIVHEKKYLMDYKLDYFLCRDFITGFRAGGIYWAMGMQVLIMLLGCCAFAWLLGF